jgi:hypothetical protein
MLLSDYSIIDNAKLSKNLKSNQIQPTINDSQTSQSHTL